MKSNDLKNIEQPTLFDEKPRCIKCGVEDETVVNHEDRLCFDCWLNL